MDEQKKAPAAPTLGRAIRGAWVQHAVELLLRLDIVEELGSGPREIGALARKLHLDQDALYRVLRALAREELLAESPPRTFALTPVSRLLLKDAPNSLRASTLMVLSPWFKRAWGHLPGVVRAGGDRLHDITGGDLWSYLAEHPEDAGVFDEAMVENTRNCAADIVAACDLSKHATLADLGGGRGEMLAAFLRQNPTLRGVLYDLPRALTHAGETLRSHDVADRCDVVEGDIFERVPPGFDAYLMKHVLHTLSDERSAVVLERCRAAMKPGAQLFVIDHVIPDEGPYDAFLDLLMLVTNPGGRERTKAEFDVLFAQTGFTCVDARPAGRVSVLVAEVR